jgi:DNA polymerase-3 subunit gamma/tau
MQGRHKIYIIDEVHQLSSAASSALLKTLEEPPENVIFVLATTDPQKLLPTIISRCQRYDFTKVRKSMLAALDMAEEQEADLYGIVVDAFTDHYILEKDLYDVLREIKSRLA